MLTVDEARARGVSLPLDDDAAADVIEETEAWLAARIGPLDGPRTEIFLDPAWNATLRLRRPTDIIDVTESDAVDATLYGGVYITRDSGSWAGPVSVLYTPTDEALIRGTLFDLLRLGTADTGFESETMGSYSYSRPRATTQSSRWALWRSLLPRLGFDSVPVRSGFDRPFGVTVMSSDIVVAGS